MTKVYEVGYLIVSSVPQEKVATEIATFEKFLAGKGAVTIAHEAPELRPLAYTMIKKMGGVHQRFTQGYFGWVKFELPSEDIAAVKAWLDAYEHMLRYLLITAPRENTYLGKKAPSAVVSNEAMDVAAITATGTPVAPSVADIDKGIDDLVKVA